MLLTHVREDGEDRLYVTRFNSVCSYFTADDSGDGLVLHLEPGWTTLPQLFNATADAVGTYVMETIAARLGIAPDDVLNQSFAKLLAIADPELPQKYRYARRSRGRQSPNRM